MAYCFAPFFPSCIEPPMPIDGSSEDPPIVENNAQYPADEHRCQVTIDTLPDDVLLYVFDFYLNQASEIEAWHTLVHVCRQWRILVFGSPCRLNLRIKCSYKTQAVKEKLDVWPALPVVVSGAYYEKPSPDNLPAALEHRNRICQIKLYLKELNVINIASLEEPFPILTDLDLGTLEFFQPFDPNPSKFLGGPGSAHLLRSLTLRDFTIPHILKLLLATPNLVTLRLNRIRKSFLTDEMVTVLSSLTRLEILDLNIDVKFDRFHPDRENQRLPLPRRTALPSLTTLKVTGDIEFLEDFMARINTPLLDHLNIVFSLYPFYRDRDRITVLDTPQLLRFISRTPKLQAPVGAHIGFNADNTCIFSLHSTQISHHVIRLKIAGVEPKQQIPFVAQFYRSLPFLLHPLEYLYICGGPRHRRQGNFMENARWLELLQPFAAVKNLYLTKEFVPDIAHALQDLVGERVMEVLPTLNNFFIDKFKPSGPVQQVLKEFIAARQLAGHPITISRWDYRHLTEATRDLFV